MQLVEKENGEVTVLELGGRLDSNTSKVLEDKVMEILGQGRKKVLMDFKDVDYINSTGLRVLLLALQQLKKGPGAAGLVHHQGLYEGSVRDFRIYRDFSHLRHPG